MGRLNDPIDGAICATHNALLGSSPLPPLSSPASPHCDRSQTCNDTNPTFIAHPAQVPNSPLVSWINECRVEWAAGPAEPRGSSAADYYVHRRLSDAVLMLVHRLRRWFSIKTASDQGLLSRLIYLFVAPHVAEEGTMLFDHEPFFHVFTVQRVRAWL